MAPVTEIKRTMADVVAERKQQMSPGRVFAEACAKDGTGASVEYDVTITDSLTSSRRKPRYPARNMLKVTDLSRDPRRWYWHETPPLPEDPELNFADIRPEVAHRFHKSPVPDLLPTTAWVQVPQDLWQDTETFESFINYRLIIRLGTAENHTIIRGEGGLLNMPQLGRMTASGPFASTLIAACDAVEQMGATADGIIINPADYYIAMSRGGLMKDLEENGVFIVRTRIVDQGTAIVGDFGHGAQLFDAGRSVIRFAEPPPGTFAEPGLSLMAQIYERVVVNLPTNFFIVTLLWRPGHDGTVMTADPDVLVVGGGAVGLFCAYHLSSRGASVAVIERGTVGGPQSSSSGNTGFVGTHGASVLAEPGMLTRGLRGLLNPAAPVAVRPGPDGELLRWLWHFRRACRTAQDTGPLVEMKQRSLAMLRELCARDGTFTESGMVLAFKTPQAFSLALAAVPSAVARGVPLRALSPAELAELEPDTEFDIHGALYNEEGAFLRVPAFVTALGRTLSAAGVDIYQETEVTGFAHSGDAVTQVRTTSGDFRPGAVVIAAGAWSARCARLLGVRLILQPVRGYSVTVEAPPPGPFGPAGARPGPAGGPRRPVLLAEGRAAVSPFGESVRFAGILEVSGLNRGPSQRRSDGLRRIVGSYLPALARTRTVETWTGLRPCTPDSLPFLGAAGPYRNLFIAAGHGAMGMGLAPASGLLIAQAVSGEQPGLDLKPFRIGRFG